ncbi:MAG TPA: arginine--tRNA ligase [Chloroflexi bacterium]|nr:arginine--tRNA ligase [Chloroflexota bacterium]
MFEEAQTSITTQIQSYCAENEIPLTETINWQPIPFSGEWGMTTSFFQIAAQEARSGKKMVVPQRAQEIAAAVAAHLGTPPGFTHVEAVRGYLNLYFDSADFSRKIVDTVLAQGVDFGRGALKNEQVMVEYSQPNTHKSFHVGHLRSAILGDALSRILDFAGYDVIRANYPGDMGLHVIKWLWNYLKFHRGEKPEKDITKWMGDMYVEANRHLEENPELEKEIREVYARWDRRDPEIVALWEETRQWSLDGFNQMYAELDIPFDIYYFNSQMEEPGKAIVKALVEREIALDERPEGPVLVKLDELLGNKQEKYRVLVILRSDGTALYSTEDLALTLKKFADYPALKRSIYVVDVRQSLHFTQVWKTMEIAGYEEPKHCHHIPYEIVNLPGNVVMASREGTIVLLEDLLREARQRALEVVEEKNPELSVDTKKNVANAVGLGALRFPMLARDNAKTVTFDWESALDFNGQAAPYIQYAHVRANSILRRATGEKFSDVATPSHELDPSEVQLIDLISRLPAEVQRAADEYKTLQITNHAYDLAKAFNDFYRNCPVIQAEPDVRNFRLCLVDAARHSMANMLKLLGIQAPEVM